MQHLRRAVHEKKNAANKEELERLCTSRIIEPVDTHTNWINSIVPDTKPDGSIGLFLRQKRRQQEH